MSLPNRPRKLPAQYDPRAIEQLVQDYYLALNNGYKYLQFQSQSAEPDRTIENMLMLADGSNWNPGGGRGLYLRNSDKWEKIRSGYYEVVTPFDYISPSQHRHIIAQDLASQDEGVITEGLQNFFAAIQSERIEGRINPGWYAVADKLATINSHIHAMGSGPNNCKFWTLDTFDGEVLELQDLRMGVEDDDDDDESGGGDPSQFTSATRLGGLCIEGNSAYSNNQRGIILTGVCDQIRLDDIYTKYLTGSGFRFGEAHAGNANGFTRECAFYGLKAHLCGRTDEEAFLITDAGTGDATNQNDFFNLRVVFPIGNGLVIRNGNTTAPTRRQQFFGPMVHGLGAGGSSRRTEGDLLTIDGNVNGLVAHGVRLNNVHTNYWSVKTTGTAGNVPVGARIYGNISNGANGVFAEYGQNCLFDMSQMSVDDIAIKAGPDITGAIEFSTSSTIDESQIDIDSTVAHLVGRSVSRVSSLPVRAAKLIPGTALTSPEIISGSDHPEGVQDATPGTLYLRQGGYGTSATESAFVKRTAKDTLTGWLQVETRERSFSRSTLLDDAEAVNTIGKTLGRMVWATGIQAGDPGLGTGTARSMPLFASGTTATSAWVDAAGVIVLTPV